MAHTLKKHERASLRHEQHDPTYYAEGERHECFRIAERAARKRERASGRLFVRNWQAEYC